MFNKLQISTKPNICKKNNFCGDRNEIKVRKFFFINNILIKYKVVLKIIIK